MKVLVGLGGNLGDPPQAFSRALDRLGEGHRLLVVSALYRSQPVGPPQPRYWNQAALLEADRPLLALLDRCQELVQEVGRDRDAEVRWGPRALDLDLLITPGIVHCGPRLHLPHPHFAERAFAVVPAAELAPDWVHPLDGRTLWELAQQVVAGDASLERVDT
jgi:2-amino-4-hydroxy-6-hydroxymethyldihydropteridine diphosphokinase